jgi:hypothetical protein
LENDHHSSPHRTQFLGGQGREISAFKQDLSIRGTIKLKNRASCCRLAATALSNKTQRLTLLDLEIETIDSSDVAHVSFENQALGDRKVFLEVLNLDQGSVLAA